MVGFGLGKAVEMFSLWTTDGVVNLLIGLCAGCVYANGIRAEFVRHCADNVVT